MVLVAFLVQADDHPVVTDDALVALELAGDRGGTVGEGAVNVGGHRNQQCRIIVGHHRRIEARRVVLGE